jgi:hypothetical protein
MNLEGPIVQQRRTPAARPLPSKLIANPELAHPLLLQVENSGVTPYRNESCPRAPWYGSTAVRKAAFLVFLLMLMHGTYLWFALQFESEEIGDGK